MKYDISNAFKYIQDIPCDLRLGDLASVKHPFFSVVIPTFGRPELLKETIESVINQKGFNEEYEILVVDNEAGEEVNGTEILLKKMDIPNLYYYKNRENVGATGNWNRCILLARAKWIIMCHDDDLLKETCLAVMKEIIEIHQKDKLEIGYIRSSAESMYESKLKVSVNMQKQRKLPKKSRTALIKRDYSDVIWGGGVTWAGAPTCGTLLNREAMISVGGYNKELSPCADCYVPYYMLGKYGVFKTYYPYGTYRWGENDTYKEKTLLGLIREYDDFLRVLSKKSYVIRFFKKEHYADCVMYYRSKGSEAGLDIPDEKINIIRPLEYSKSKLKLLYLIRKTHSVWKKIRAK